MVTQSFWYFYALSDIEKVGTRIRLEPEDVQVYSSLYEIASNLKEALNLLVNGMHLQQDLTYFSREQLPDDNT